MQGIKHAQKQFKGKCMQNMQNQRLKGINKKRWKKQRKQTRKMLENIVRKIWKPNVSAT